MQYEDLPNDVSAEIATMGDSGYFPDPGAEFWWLKDAQSGGISGSVSWSLASGLGQSIGLVDTGINGDHQDFRDGYIVQNIDGSEQRPSDPHGTRVGGLVLGRVDNNIAGMGLAPGASISATTIDFSQSVDYESLAEILSSQRAVDVSNNSWGFTRSFQDNFMRSAPGAMQDALEDGVRDGRDGLGTVYVFAAGNGRFMWDGTNRGDDSNFHNLSNARQTIAVGATDKDGHVAVFSSPGTNLLVSAPGQGLLTADGLEGDSDGAVSVSGTSFSAALVSSTVALMLEVNPELGYRDVQEILAITARPDVDAQSSEKGEGAVVNGAQFINGGGFVFSRDLGFGRIDTEAAVRLAKSWRYRSDAENEVSNKQRFEDVEGTLPQSDYVEMTIEVGDDLEDIHLQWIELGLSISGIPLRDLRIELISPSESISLIAPNLSGIGSKTSLDFTFSSAAHWGELVPGNWTLRLIHSQAVESLRVEAAELTFYGDSEQRNEHYLTPVWLDLVEKDDSRLYVEAPDYSPNDSPSILNLAAMDRGMSVDLETGRGLAGTQTFTVGEGFGSLQGSGYDDNLTGTFEKEHIRGGGGSDTLRGGTDTDWLFGEDDDDLLAGNGGADLVRGGAGNDRMFGGAEHDTLAGNGGDDFLDGGVGDDVLIGGSGTDVLFGGSGADVFVFASIGQSRHGSARDTIADFQAGIDKIDLSRIGELTFTGTNYSGSGNEVRYNGTIGRLYVDLDGDMASEFSVDVEGSPILDFSDIIL